MAVGSNGFRKKWVNSWNDLIQLLVFFLKNPFAISGGVIKMFLMDYLLKEENLGVILYKMELTKAW